MTRFPVVSALFLLLALTAFAIPLVKVTKRDPVPKSPQPTVENPQPNNLLRADLELFPAHPFSEVKINTGHTSHLLTPNQPFTEIFLPRTGTSPLKISANWPAGTPETALRVEIFPDGQDELSFTIWGQESAFSELPLPAFPID